MLGRKAHELARGDVFGVVRFITKAAPALLPKSRWNSGDAHFRSVDEPLLCVLVCAYDNPAGLLDGLKPTCSSGRVLLHWIARAAQCCQLSASPAGVSGLGDGVPDQYWRRGNRLPQDSAA